MQFSSAKYSLIHPDYGISPMQITKYIQLMEHAHYSDPEYRICTEFVYITQKLFNTEHTSLHFSVILLTKLKIFVNVKSNIK